MLTRLEFRSRGERGPFFTVQLMRVEWQGVRTAAAALATPVENTRRKEKSEE